jgi:hypothetical protein
MNKIRKLPFLILLALVCSSLCWAQSMVTQRPAETRSLRSSMVTTQPGAASRGEVSRRRARIALVAWQREILMLQQAEVRSESS